MTKEDIARFISLLKFPDPPEKDTVTTELEKVENKEDLVPALIELLSTTDNSLTKQAAITALQHIGADLSLRPLLDQLLHEESKSTMLVIIKTLSILESPGALETLEKIVNRSDDPEIIQVASQAIQIIQGISPSYSLEEI